MAKFLGPPPEPEPELEGEGTGPRLVRALRPQEPMLDSIGLSLKEDLAYLGRIAAGEIRPSPTPWNTLNILLDGGLWPEPYFLIGKPGTGKTQLAIQLAHHACVNGTPTVYVPLEIPRLQATARFISAAAPAHDPIVWSTLYRGLDAKALARAQVLATELEKLPFYFARTGWDAWPYDRLGPLAEELTRLHGGQRILVILDFLQIIDAVDRNEPLMEVVQKAAKQVVAICKQLDACVLVLSATARSYYPLCDARDRTPKSGLPPIGEGHPGWLMGLGKESGNIEFAAANQLVLCNDYDGTTWLALCKQRAGRAGWARLDFDGSKFSDPDLDSCDDDT